MIKAITIIFLTLLRSKNLKDFIQVCNQITQGAAYVQTEK